MSISFLQHQTKRESLSSCRCEMKNSYKVYGVFWDHQEWTPFDSLVVTPYTYGFDYKEKSCLFDLVGMYRSIKISELLSVESADEWNRICENLAKYSRIAVEIDYVTSPESMIACSFYRKRLCQIHYALKQKLPSAEIVIQIPDENRTSWHHLRTNAS